jgi:hypothetical protein
MLIKRTSFLLFVFAKVIFAKTVANQSALMYNVMATDKDADSTVYDPHAKMRTIKDF